MSNTVREGDQVNAAIEAEGLVKTYRGRVHALGGVTFAVEPGTVFALLGPNGAGKSTTVRVLTTLTRPDAGEARVLGVDVVREPERVRRAVGVVAQRSGIDREATGRENLVLQGRIHGLGGRDLRARVSELLERLGLVEVAGRLVRTYSGGMQRRLDLALGLVHRPRVLFLDEPTTGLDPEIRTGVWREISRLAREDGLTVLLTTHYLEEADQLADRLAIVDRGLVVVEGPPEQLKRELEGDAVLVELGAPEANGRATGALAGVSGVRDVALDGRSLRARVPSGATALPQVLGALDARGVTVASVTVSRPSLDDVYLRYTGRAFRDADAADRAQEGDTR
jgi:ABC-2 type transport system ATP-binding protein